MGINASKNIKLSTKERELIYAEFSRIKPIDLANLEKAILLQLLPKLLQFIMTKVSELILPKTHEFVLTIKRKNVTEEETRLILFKMLVQELELKHKFCLELQLINNFGRNNEDINLELAFINTGRIHNADINLELSLTGNYDYYRITVYPPSQYDFSRRLGINYYQTLHIGDYPSCMMCDQTPIIYDRLWGFYCLSCVEKAPRGPLLRSSQSEVRRTGPSQREQSLRSRGQVGRYKQPYWKLKAFYDKGFYAFALQFQIMLELGMLENPNNIITSKKSPIYLEKECVICYENAPTGIFRECRHACLCHRCQKSYNLTKCPMCQSEPVHWDMII